MKMVEVYVVKENDFKEYVLKNTLGVGFNNIEKPTPPILDAGNGITTIPDPNLADNFILKVNGKVLTNLMDFTASDTSIIFNEPLEIGDKITIEDSISDNVTKVATKNSYSKTALFKLFSNLIKLKYNHIYNFTLPIYDRENNKEVNFSTQFYSKHDPYYTTVKKIRLDTGDLLVNATDAQISKLIYLNSKDVNDILTNGDGGTPDEVTVAATNVVRYRTDIDLCWAMYLSASGKYGVISKKIGNIEIEKNIKVPYIEIMIKHFKELLATNEDLLNGGDTTPVSFVKANATSYTVSNRGVF